MGDNGPHAVRAEEMIRHLAAWSWQFALDDIGTGANSLTYRHALAIFRGKIDGSFVGDILTKPRSQATVRGIVEPVRGFSMVTSRSLSTTRDQPWRRN